MGLTVALILYALAFAAGAGYEFVKGDQHEPA
jgi:hypothetical protein